MTAARSLIPEIEDALQRGDAQKRGETLRRITALFLDGSAYFNDEQVKLFDDVLLRALKRPSTQWEEETTRVIVDWARKLTSGFGGQPPGLKPRDKGRLGRLSDPAGRNASERRAGLERNDVDADPPTKRGRLIGVGKQSTRAPAPSTGVVATACRRRVDGRQGRPGAVGIATRTSPAGDGQSGRRRGS